MAVLRGLGYAGAYLGGTHDAEQVQWIIRRAGELAPQWSALADELRFGRSEGFYLSERPTSLSRARPTSTLIPRTLDLMGTLLPVTRPGRLRRILRRLCAWIDRRPALAKLLETFELAVKRPTFGCQACGNCVLGHLEYVCPQTCPKQIRNGPCGGTDMGRCEVVDKACIWVGVWERAAAARRVDDLKTFIPPPDRALTGTSSWINYFLDRDRRPSR